jgi:hypothetical protein
LMLVILFCIRGDFSSGGEEENGTVPFYARI